MTLDINLLSNTNFTDLLTVFFIRVNSGHRLVVWLPFLVVKCLCYFYFVSIYYFEQEFNHQTVACTQHKHFLLQLPRLLLLPTIHPLPSNQFLIPLTTSCRLYYGNKLMHDHPCIIQYQSIHTFTNWLLPHLIPP